MTWRDAGQLVCHMGPSWLAFRAAYAAERRLGVLERRAPAAEWEDVPLSGCLRTPELAAAIAYLEYRRRCPAAFFFEPAARADYAPLLRAFDGSAGPQSAADRIAGGEFPFFGGLWIRTGNPPDWHRNAITGQQAPLRHWAQLDEFAYGDVKVIWDLNRFGFAYTLVRAYWLTGEERYAELFWDLVEDWRSHNPPNVGINWKCGQEAGLRAMAWCFALYGFLEARATTPHRVRALAEMLAASGRRIAANLGYAVSQRNNHGISEAAALWTLGTLFPEFRDAQRWRRTGARHLEGLGRALIYPDGAFSQHSLNYHRLMLHDYLWALRLADSNGVPFSAGLRQRVGRAGEFLLSVMDEPSGRCPHYGPDDGSWILPLNNCGPCDFRPVTQAVAALCYGTRRRGPGPWDEDLLWLFGPQATLVRIEPPPRADLAAAAGGYFTLRCPDGFAFVRAARFRHRPGDADLLHTDLWWRGQNVAMDAGTLSYNSPGASFSQTRFHNTVTVDGLDQMRRVTRFLWLPWAAGGVLHTAGSAGGGLSYWEGQHDGYRRGRRPAAHRRGILRIGNGWWVVLDALFSRVPHRYALHWLMPDWPFLWDEARAHLACDTPAGRYGVTVGADAAAAVSVVRAQPDGLRGWHAPGYGRREPALSLECAAEAPAARFWTVFGPGEVRVTAESAPALAIESETFDLRLSLASDPHAGGPLLRRAQAAGEFQDLLEV